MGWVVTVGFAAETLTPRVVEMAPAGEATRLEAAAWTAASVSAGLVADGVPPGVASGTARTASALMLPAESRSVRKQAGSRQLREVRREARRASRAASPNEARSPVRVRPTVTTVLGT